MPPFISIIVPTYNYGRFISDALDSILAQTFTEWECVIVDDGSTDDTLSVVEAYAAKTDRFRCVSQQNLGPSAARNTGIKNSMGKYLQFLDADDLIQPEKLARQGLFLDKHPQVDIVYSEMRYFHADAADELFYSMSTPDHAWMPCVSGSGLEVLDALLRSNIMVSSSPLIRASLIQEVGLFDETLKAQEDWHYWLRCAIQNKYFAFLDCENAFALVRRHPASTSQSGCRRISAVTTYDMWRKTPSVSLCPALSALHQSIVFQAACDALDETYQNGSLFQPLGKILRIGFDYRKYRWAIKQIERVCRRRLRHSRTLPQQ